MPDLFTSQSHLTQVRIVHGMGTGALRKAVWDRLKKYNFIAKYEFAPSAQGGSGATIVTLKE